MNLNGLEGLVEGFKEAYTLGTELQGCIAFHDQLDTLMC